MFEQTEIIKIFDEEISTEEKFKRMKKAFPVGKVKIINMYPMDFEEFLLANGNEELINEIKKCYTNLEPMSDVLHRKALELYKLYLCIGGMPEAVKIENIYKSVPAQLGNMSNKFQYGKIDSNARKRDYESSLNWLLSSTMVQKSNLLGKVEIPPLRVYYT